MRKEPLPLPSTLSRRRFIAFSTATLILPQVFRNQAYANQELSLTFLSDEPRNAEPNLQALIGNQITPLEHFYIRTHGETPKLDAATFELAIEGMVQRVSRTKLGQLSSDFQPVEVEATMTCAGNRRTEMSAIKPIKGVAWGPGAIGNAKWKGIRLSDLLRKAGLKESAKHVWFEGVDKISHDGAVITFGGSIPLEKALADDSPALVAFEMNGMPLTADHGFPFRTVVPGFIGARSVKWLRRIVVSDRSSPNHYEAEAYKIVPDNDPKWVEKSPAIEEWPLNSVIAEPAPDAVVRAGMLTVKGYALASGGVGAALKQVEVSADGGATWHPARFTTPAKPYVWQLWQAEVPVSAKTTVLTVRAADSNGVQPAKVAWNAKGYMYNAWHHVPIRVNG